MKIKLMKKIIGQIFNFFDDKEQPGIPQYDPVHFGGMIIFTILGISLTFWLLWALLVFGGGLQAKVLPFLAVIFTSKTAGDFGYIGYPYAMGIFEGWVTNLVALVLLALVILGIWHIFEKARAGEKNEDQLQR